MDGNERVEVIITGDPISADDLHGLAKQADGALVAFYGIVRGETEGKAVSSLEYEAYTSMAEHKSREIAESALEKWEVDRIRIIHRVGIVGIGEISVLIGVSAAHRTPAFDACEYCIDRLKETVPIWKKETFADGSESWVNHP